jgi:DNA helicase IV
LSTDEIRDEQEYVSVLYGRLDELRDRASTRLAGVLRQAGGTHQARSERETFSILYSQQLAQFDAAENGLCFGRLDFREGEPRYIGRIGIHDDSEGDYKQLLMDWRADAARPFYLATAASPADVRRRRHIKTRGRTVVSLDDEVLDLAAADPGKHEGLTGESALLAALGASRTGRMSDIVATIQAEQDWIIRSALGGVLVVQGGPGTGKTAVALHRAAFLLYTYREQLTKRGVLVVGPNATFLRYISQVLPSLGETSVLLSTIADLYPGVSARGSEPPATAEIKGRLAMADVVKAAVRDRQQVPSKAIEVQADRETLRLSPAAVNKAVQRARRSRRPHNQARQVFARELVDALTRQLVARVGANVLDEENLLGAADVDEIRQDLRREPGIRALIERLWPVLTPQRLLEDLFSSPGRLASAAPRLTEAERSVLLRDAGSEWTPADVPLLDEAAELLGEDERAVRAAARRRRRERVAYARGVLDIISRDTEDDPEILMGADVLDATGLATRHEDDESLTAAERAAGDRTWAFGHVIVDEAQELSEMDWRMLMRRCPVRSMTIVGDVAQTGSVAGASSWTQVLDRYQGDRWRLTGLTINYRTPAEIMDIAADVLTAIDPELEPPQSVRYTGVKPWRLAVADDELPGRLAEATKRAAACLGDGRLAVIVPAARLEELGQVISAAVPGTAVGEQPDLERPVVVLTVRQAKGLEFDSVLIGDPDGILAESRRGLNDLYVALTRATQRLGVVHAGIVPDVLAGLSPSEGAALALQGSR